MPEDENGLSDFLDSLSEAPPAVEAVSVSPASLSTVGFETDDDDLSDFLDAPPTLSPTVSITPAITPPIAVDGLASDDDESLSDFFEGSGIKVHQQDNRLIKPWMKFHQFKLVKTIEGVRELVDLALAHGRCGLDLETEGFDNRVDYAPDGTKATVHKIVGYCISVRGVGHYIPVRHRFNPLYGEKDPNAPLQETEAEIRRLCLASQPELTEEGKKEDPLASSKIVGGKPRMLIYFWNAKFDQEFLFPITGIEFWHPDSFDDGMLAAYSVYSDDPNLGLKDKAQKRLSIFDPAQLVDGKPAALPYEMIEFPELFPAKTASRDRKFYDLYPEEGSPVVIYACSDAICTEALCERDKKTPWEHTIPDVKYAYKNVVEEAYEQKYYFTYRLEKQTVQAVRDMERQRAKIDKSEILVLLKKAGEELAKYEDLIKALAKKSGFDHFNPGSSQQLSNFLFESDGLNISPKPEKNVASGFYKTDAATLEHMAENPDAPPVLGWIVKYRQIDKIIGTYLTSMSENCDSQDQLRFKFNQTGATTGRFTAPAGEPDHGYAGIPIQGIPARDDPKKPEVAHSLRRIFVARPGYTLVKVDYAGQELRIVANLSGEPKWVDEFVKARSEGREADLHTLTAKAFFGEHITKDDKVERNMGKIANFSLIYGGGSSAIMRATKCDKVEAVRRKANFDKSVPVFAGWVKGQHAGVKKHKGVVTAFRRFIAIPDANLKAGELDSNGVAVTPDDARKIQASCERKSTNFPIQGCLNFTSLIQTRKGPQSIGSLLGSEFEVWTGDRWAQATAHNMGSCELAEIQLKDGTLIECDTRHKLLVVTDKGYEWVTYIELEPNMKVATALCDALEFEVDPLPKVILSQAAGYQHPFSIPIDLVELWYWLGRYIGDGYIDDRGGIHFCFGDHERVAIDRCKNFWTKVGLNPIEGSATHTPHIKESTRYTVDVWSINLIRWLLCLGFKKGVTAHTKRLPERIFRESLENRKSFLQGIMDSDGHRPKLPLKIDGVWEKNKKGNPYNVHLCQRPLLVDIKRLLRTVGVESVLRGPYRSGSNKDGLDTISYRIDIQRRMYDRNVRGLPARLPKFDDMDAPSFLVQEFLEQGPFSRKTFQGNESAYHLYLRLRDGRGEVTVYTLKYLCQLLGVTLKSPIYGYRRLVSKVALGRKEDTYTLSVQDPLHRFESDSVITKNSGADILKISLVKLLKEFHRQGWRREGGDDSVRMIMTVHDEIVFEIKHERLTQAMPIIIEAMESPWKMAKWKIPLVVEPLLGLTWEAKVDWHAMMTGKKPVPSWLEGIIQPGGHHAEPVPTPAKSLSQPPIQEPARATPTLPPAAPRRDSVPPSSSTHGTRQVATFALASTYLTNRMVDVVFESVAGSLDPENHIYLRLIDNGGNILLDPSHHLLPILPEKLKLRFQDRNLGSGMYEIREEPL